MWISQLARLIVDLTFGRITDYYNSCRYQKLLKSLEDDLHIYRSMEVLLDSLDASRVGFFYFHNGGGSIVPGKSKYVSMIEEKRRDKDAVCRKSDTQRVIVTDGYLGSIVQMLFSEDRIIKMRIEDLPRSSFKDMYVLDGIEESLVCYIASNKDHIWYLKICFDQKAGELTPESRTAINNCRTHISNILIKYFKISDRQ